VRFALPSVDVLALRQHDLQFDEIAQAVDLVEVHPCAAGEKYFAPFCDNAANHQHAAERSDERRRILASDPRVDRFLRSGPIVPLV
jgi:hypothetical protein